jgi:hypothetical protein
MFLPARSRPRRRQVSPQLNCQSFPPPYRARYLYRGQRIYRPATHASPTSKKCTMSMPSTGSVICLSFSPPPQLDRAALLVLPPMQNQLDHSGWYGLDDMCDTVFTRMNIGGRRLILKVKFQVRPTTRCIVIVETGPLLMKMRCQRGTPLPSYSSSHKLRPCST